MRNLAMTKRARTCQLSLLGTTWQRFPKDGGKVAKWQCGQNGSWRAGLLHRPAREAREFITALINDVAVQKG